MLNANWRIDTNMGNYFSNNAVFLSAKRALMRYNIENRAFKELEKQTHKPLAAPKHEAGIIDYHESLKSNFFKTIFNHSSFLNEIHLFLKSYSR